MHRINFPAKKRRRLSPSFETVNNKQFTPTKIHKTGKCQKYHIVKNYKKIMKPGKNGKQEAVRKDIMVYENYRYWYHSSHKMKGLIKHYWRCSKYDTKSINGCRCIIHTIERAGETYPVTKKYGDIDIYQRVAPHALLCSPNWTPEMAEYQMCKEIISKTSIHNRTYRSKYKEFQRLFPQLAIKHFTTFSKIESYLKRNPGKVKTPADVWQYIDLLQTTKFGYNFWKHHLHGDRFDNKEWKQVETEFRNNNKNINVDQHPDVHFDPNRLELINIANERELLKLKEEYYHSKVITSDLPECFISNIYLGHTESGDVILQSRHGGMRLGHPQVTKIYIDCTFNIPKGVYGTFFTQICVIHACIDAPKPASYTRNVYPCAILLLTSKKKETYIAAFKKLKTENKARYGIEFNNVRGISSDMEWNLFQQVRNEVFTHADFLLCLFHYMQANIRKIKTLGLFVLLKNKNGSETGRKHSGFYIILLKYLYAAFVHPTWVQQYQESLTETLMREVPRGQKLAMKSFLKYSRATYYDRFPIKWWNCSQRMNLEFTNNPSETFNKHWKDDLGSKPNILAMTNAYREIDATATVSFATHIQNPASTDYFNKKRRLKRQRDRAILKKMRQYNNTCRNNIDQLGADNTTLDLHTSHVNTMFSLMKYYEDEIDKILAELEAEDKYLDTDRNEEKMENNTIETINNNVHINYTLKRYTDITALNTADLLSDIQCNRLNEQIKKSQYWNQVMEHVNFIDNKHRKIANAEQLQTYYGRLDSQLRGVIIAFQDYNVWHPGIIIDVEGTLMQIFLPHEKRFDRLLEILGTKHIGKIKIL